MFEFSAEDITSDYGFLLRLVNTFRHWRVLPNVLQSKWMPRPLKNLRLLICAKSSYVPTYIADWLVWAFKITFI